MVLFLSAHCSSGNLSTRPEIFLPCLFSWAAVLYSFNLCIYMKNFHFSGSHTFFPMVPSGKARAFWGPHPLGGCLPSPAAGNLLSVFLVILTLRSGYFSTRADRQSARARLAHQFHCGRRADFRVEVGNDRLRTLLIDFDDPASTRQRAARIVNDADDAFLDAFGAEARIQDQ